MSLRRCSRRSFSAFRKLGLREVPGQPDFDKVSRALGQQLLHTPSVAGWTYGKAWITQGLLIERGNFVRDWPGLQTRRKC